MLKKIQNRSGASPQPCFVPFDTSNSGECSPFSITDGLIPSWNDRVMPTRAAGQPILLRIAHRPGQCTEWCARAHTPHHTHTHTFNSPFSRTTQVSQYQKGKTNPDFTEARDSEWQWHQPGHIQVCTLLQTDNHTSTPPLCFLQARCPSCRPTNSVKALKAKSKH